MKSQLQIKSKFSDKTKEKTKTKKHLPLEVNLDQIMNPSPVVRALYNNTPGTLEQFGPWNDRPNWEGEKRVFVFGNISTPGRPKRKINHKIVSLYRRKHGNKEYAFAFEHISTTDLLENLVDSTRELGRYMKPNLVTRTGFDQNSMNQYNAENPRGPQVLGVEVTSTEEVYEWEWEKIKPQLIQWKKDGIISEDCQFTAWLGIKKYSVSSWEQFISLSLDELVLCNRVGEQAIGLFDSKNMNAAILQLARETGRERLKKSLSSNETGRGRKV